MLRFLVNSNFLKIQSFITCLSNRKVVLFLENYLKIVSKDYAFGSRWKRSHRSGRPEIWRNSLGVEEGQKKGTESTKMFEKEEEKDFVHPSHHQKVREGIERTEEKERKKKDKEKENHSLHSKDDRQIRRREWRTGPKKKETEA